MDLILANRPAAPYTVQRTLDSDERTALITHALTNDESAGADKLLDHAWRLRQWFACDCRAPGTAPAILYVSRTSSGRYQLARMMDRPSHQGDCPFGREPPSDTAGRGGGGLSPLGQLLMRWFSAAHLNVFYPYDAEDLVSSQYVSLREVSKSLDLTPGHRLFNYSRTHPQGLPELIKRMRQSPANEHTSGIYLAVLRAFIVAELRAALAVPHIEPESFCSQELLQASLDEAPERYRDPGPYVAVFELVVMPDRHVRVREVLGYPVYSHRQLIPVDAPHERRTLRLLLELQRTLVETRQMVVSIRKTLPDSPLNARGVSFQLGRIGPNGRPVRVVDVLCIDALQTPRAILEPVPGSDVIYHCVNSYEPALSGADHLFMQAAMARLLDGLERSPLSDRPSFTNPGKARPSTYKE